MPAADETAGDKLYVFPERDGNTIVQRFLLIVVQYMSVTNLLVKTFSYADRSKGGGSFQIEPGIVPVILTNHR